MFRFEHSKTTCAQDIPGPRFVVPLLFSRLVMVHDSRMVHDRNDNLPFAVELWTEASLRRIRPISPRRRTSRSFWAFGIPFWASLPLRFADFCDRPFESLNFRSEALSQFAGHML